jgi:prepilin-type N-terminal cleavage/methylation domain-containing protein
MRNQNKGFTLIELMIVVTIIGILAVVAGPELMKYQIRAKTAEATQNVAKIADGARAYYLSEMTNRQGQLIAKQFPQQTNETPGNFACQNNAPFKHDPTQFNDVASFGSESWQSLQFSVSKPFLYSYTFEENGEGQNAFFTACVCGDLDCDTLPSLFEQTGAVDQNNQVVINQLYREAELE